MSDFEVGYTEANVFKACWKAVKTIVGTWWFCRKRGLPRGKWFAVYYAGTEYKIAEFGCLPAAENNAKLFVEALYTINPNTCAGPLV